MSHTPAIRISQHQRHQSPPTYPAYSAAASPMAIPQAREPVPPPLPPPTYIPELSAGQDPGWQWGNDPNSAEFGRSAPVKPGSSLLGGVGKAMRHGEELDHILPYAFNNARRGSSISTVTVGRDHEMLEDNPAHSDEDGSSSRRASVHG